MKNYEEDGTNCLAYTVEAVNMLSGVGTVRICSNRSNKRQLSVLKWRT